jgi:hypothetical protein
MKVLILAPVVLSSVLLAAHFLRAGQFALVALSLGTPLLLALRRSWATTTVQVLLILGSLEWLRTLAVLMEARRAAGEPFVRLVLILAVVAALTAGSALGLGRARRTRGLPRPAGAS